MVYSEPNMNDMAEATQIQVTLNDKFPQWKSLQSFYSYRTKGSQNT
jgi:hypothetical protein